ncbi:hypothetical protein Tco_1436551, partial [Tanacetum coccineum]
TIFIVSDIYTSHLKNHSSEKPEQTSNVVLPFVVTRDTDINVSHGRIRVTESNVTMTKVIKEEFEKLESLKISDDSFTCNTSLEIFHKEFNRMSRMDDDLFTYKVEIPGLASIPCDLNKEDDSKQQMAHGSNVDMEYDPSNNALWIYWTKGDDEVELTDEESSDFDDENEVAEIFRIDTNILMDLKPTKNIRMTGCMSGIKTYHRYMKNHGQTMEYGRNPLLLNIIVNHSYSRMDIQNGQLVAGKMIDIVMVGTFLEHTYHHGRMIDDDDESHNKGWKRWNGYENSIHDHEERENEEEYENKERCELFDNPHQETPVCKIRRFKLIKYSFGEDEEYIAIKEHEYDDLTSTNEDACRTDQEIFHRMDEGWTVTRAV